MHGLGLLDGMDVAVGQPEDAEAGDGFRPLVEDEVAGKDLDVEEADVLAVGHEVAPVLGPGGGHGRLHQLEVLGLLVGDDEEAVAEMIDRVLDPVAAGSHHRGGRVGLVARDEPYLRRHHGVQEQDDERLALGLAHVEVEGPVVLLVHEDVVARVGPEPVSVHAPGPLGLVQGRVEEGGVVVGPGDAVVGVGHGVGKVDARHVGRVGEKAVVGAHTEGAQGEVVVPLGQLVLVDQHLLAVAAGHGLDRRLRRAEPGATAVDAVLAALDGA